MENGEILPQIVSRSKHIILKHWSKWNEQQKTNAAVVGRLMNNIKLGYYPTDPDNISLMLRAIRFPDGVMYLNAYTKEENYQKYFDFLEKLRQSGETNMYGAAPYLQSKFSELHGSREKANAILIAWIKTFEMEEGDEPC